jgi:DNA polymerase delta subunit 2
MEDCPEIFFCGNQPEYMTKLITSTLPLNHLNQENLTLFVLYLAAGGQKVRLVCLPSFAQTQTAVLVNLNTLDCHPLSFSIGLPSSVAER